MTADSEIDIYSDSRRKRIRRTGRSRRTKIIAICAAAAVVLAAACIVAWRKISADNAEKKHLAEVRAALDVETFYGGVTVQGVDLGGMTMEQAKAAVSAKETSADGTYRVTIAYGDQKWELTQKDLAFTYDTDEVLEKAYAYGRTGDRETRYRQVTALKTKPVRYALTAAPKTDALKPKVDGIAAKVKKAPVEPTVTAFNAGSGTFSFRDGTPGVTADGDALWADVKAVVEGPRVGTVQLRTKSVPFRKTVADIKSHMSKLGTFSTVSTNNYNGTYNMKKALLSVNGTCIPAGGTFSFFAVAGPCDESHGYLPAGALLNGRHVEEYGGGICQSSTTIYGAGLRSNLQVVERYNHSLPSSYCEIGQDATVSYPDLDLKMKNTTEYPVYIATSTSGNTLTATMYGYQSPDYDDIEITSQVDEVIPAPTKAVYTESSSLAKNAVELEQRARAGYRASARRVYYKNGSTVRTESLNSSYYPAMPAYYSYGKGTDASRLQTSSQPASSKPASSKPASSTPASSTPASSKPASSEPSSSKPEENSSSGTSASGSGH